MVVEASLDLLYLRNEKKNIMSNKSVAPGKRVLDLCREHGTLEQTFYNWNAKYGGMRVNTTRTVMSHHLN